MEVVEEVVNISWELVVEVEGVNIFYEQVEVVEEVEHIS